MLLYEYCIIICIRLSEFCNSHMQIQIIILKNVSISVTVVTTGFKLLHINKLKHTKGE